MSDYTETESESVSESEDDMVNNTYSCDMASNILKNYNILYSIGSGSSSTVWLAYNIENRNFYAIKIQNPDDYNEGKAEIKFASKLPKEPNVFNNVIEHFDYVDSSMNKFICSVWNLHCGSIDSVIRKSGYNNGFSYNIIKNIMKQLCTAIQILHNNFKVFHADLKTDNILVKGVNSKDSYVINRYVQLDFPKRYYDEKKKYWDSLGNKPDKINTMKSNDKIMLRKIVHKEIMKIITDELKLQNNNSNIIDNKYIDNMSISISDFGSICHINDTYTSQFGTRYYMAPEIILMGKCGLMVDIWSIGCILYELASGRLLFDPIKDKKYSRDYYHLVLIEETCGTFSKSFLSKTKFSKNFFDKNCMIMDYKYDNVVIGSRLERKISENNMSVNTINYIKPLLSRILQIDPNKRCNINELLHWI
jgi:serine/threonine-protein kinase SRPK3